MMENGGASSGCEQGGGLAFQAGTASPEANPQHGVKHALSP
mgnify:CR=1 FL=1